MTFIQQQFKVLQTIAKEAQTSLVGKHLGLTLLRQEKTLNSMHAEFAEATPVTSLVAYVNFLRTLTAQSRDEAWEVVSVPHLLSSTACPAVTARGNGAIPLSSDMLRESFILEEHILGGHIDGLPELEGNAFHLTDELNQSVEEFCLIGDYRRLRMAFTPKKLKERILPDFSSFDTIGKSRYQRLHHMIDLLEEHGSTVEALITRPQVLCDLSVILSQRNGRYTHIKELCPNLKALVHYAEPIAPYKEDIRQFLSGTKSVWVKALFAPSGLLATQTTTQKENLIQLHCENGTFYEFIPTKDIRTDGTLLRHHRRFNAAQVEEKGEYLVVLSNTSGLIALNTERLVRVISKEPFVVEYLCFAYNLNGFGENIRLDMLEAVISTANHSALGHGFHIRDYMVGNDIDNKRSYWVLEINRALNHAGTKALQSVTNALHQEMSLRNNHYKTATETDTMPLPHIVFVPIGTFSNMASTITRKHIDDTDDAENIHHLLQATADKVILQAESTI